MSDTPDQEDVKAEEVEDLPLEERVANLEQDVLELIEEREDLYSEVDKMKNEINRISGLMGSARNAVSSKDDKTLQDVAKKFQR
jgi:predicted RNase H-like nuclease (RuvC/YqgF family)